jgi:hypothetical protein
MWGCIILPKYEKIKGVLIIHPLNHIILIGLERM